MAMDEQRKFVMEVVEPYRATKVATPSSGTFSSASRTAFSIQIPDAGDRPQSQATQTAGATPWQSPLA